jgi:hypothetical protein
LIVRFVSEGDHDFNLREDVEGLLRDEIFQVFIDAHLGSGLALATIYLGHLILPCFARPGIFLAGLVKRLTNSLRVHRLLGEAFETSDTNQVTRLKEACTWKIKAMLNDSILMYTKPRERQAVSVRSQNDGKASMENYVLFGERRTPTGGLLWCIKELLVEGIHFSHGIVLPSRLYIFQIVQIILSILIFWLILSGIPVAADAADEAKAELPEGLPQWYYDLM